MSRQTGPIGIFDSGYGGLTIMRKIVKSLPEYDYLYLGDNARTPYGTRSFETIYEYTLECVSFLLSQGCPLVILACNTASAKALRTIQQKNLEKLNPKARVLGVIRPSAEVIGNYSQSGQVGILGTNGTIQSLSYLMEIEKFFPKLQVFQQACPMWVSLVENGEHENAGSDYFVAKYLNQLMTKGTSIDTILLACTHYPLLLHKIQNHLKEKSIMVIDQGDLVAPSLVDYLSRHPEIDEQCTKNTTRRFLTTDSTEHFDQKASVFFGEAVSSEFVHI